MKKQAKFIVLIIIILTSFTLFPLNAELSAYQKYPKGIGVQFSPSIWGLSYHNRFNEQAFQGTVGITYDPDPLWSSKLAYGISLDYQKTLFGNDFNEYLGAQLYITTSLAHTGEIPYDSSSSEFSSYVAHLILGAGFGVEILFFQNFSLPVEIVYEFSYNPTENQLQNAFSIDLVPKIGLRYRFK